MYLRGFRRNIEMLKISKDGTGTYQRVNVFDLEVFRVMCLCCYYVPGAVGVPVSTTFLTVRFEVRDVGLWKLLCEHVFALAGASLAPLRDQLRDTADWADVVNRVLASRGKARRVQDEDFQFTDLDSLDRVPFAFQEDCVDSILEKRLNGGRGDIYWSPVGSGKTYTFLAAFAMLIHKQRAPSYVVYTLPPAAMKSIALEIERFGYPVNLVWNLKESRPEGYRGRVSDDFLPFHINIVFHDHLRKPQNVSRMMTLAPDMFIMIDEVHLLMDMKTLRSSTGIEVCRVAKDFMAMTGTFIKDTDPTGIIQWMSQLVPFELNMKNYLCGVASIISNKYHHGIEERRHVTAVSMNAKEQKRYAECVTERLGGTSPIMKFREAVDICYEVTERHLVNDVLKHLADSGEETVFVVAKDTAMQDRLAHQYRTRGIRVHCIDAQHPLHLTPESDCHGIQIVITTIRHVTGYTLTKIKTMFTGVYFSNQATRTQMMGRIIRIGQLSPHVDVHILHTGLLSYTLQRYESAKSLEAALGELARNIQEIA